MYTYIYTHVCVYIRICICIYIYIYTHKYLAHVDDVEGVALLTLLPQYYYH